MSKKQIQLVIKGYKKNGKSTTLDMDSDGNIKNDFFQGHVLYSPKEGLKGKSEFHKYIKHIKIHNYLKVEIENAFEGGGVIWEKTVIPSKAKEELKLAFNGIVTMTPEQIKIAELEAKINKLAGIKSDDDIKSEAEKREDAVKEYVRLYGEEPHHRASIDTINDKIKSYKPE